MGLFDRFKRKKPAAEPVPVEADQPVDQQPEEQVAEQRPAEQTPTQRPHEPSRLRGALNRTRAFLATAFASDPEGLVEPEFYDEWVDGLVLADVGAGLGQELADEISSEMKSRGWVKKKQVAQVARDVIKERLTSGVSEPVPLDPGQLSVVLLVGVNGSGKTTLAAKLAHRLHNDGRRVLLCAADTFRAAAVDQLKIWADRIGVDSVLGQQDADPASVVFDATQAASARGSEVLIVDTAGRLQTKSNLMAELEKVTRTVDKACPGANVAHILVLDATVGQNALSQAALFNECCPLTGLAVTKLDGTAKGGALLAVVDQLKVPVLYVGVGEQPTDLVDFDASEFAAGIVPEA